MGKALCALLLCAFVSLSSPDGALGADYASFSSFYKEKSLLSWREIGIGVLISVASAGLGAAAGGAALLSAAVEGGVMSLGIGAIDAYFKQMAYENLGEALKDSPNFPLFVNDNGPRIIKAVHTYLEKHYDKDEPSSTDRNVSALKAASKMLASFVADGRGTLGNKNQAAIRREYLRVRCLQGLLEFMANDNEAAWSSMEQAYGYYGEMDGNIDAIQFILGTSGLLIRKLPLQESTNYVSAAIKSDMNSPLLPLLFAIYLSRVGDLEMITPDFLEKFYITLMGIPNKLISESCYGVFGLTILQELKQLSDDIEAWALNKDALPFKSLDGAIEYCAAKLGEYREFVKFADYFKRTMPSFEKVEGKEAFSEIYAAGLKDYGRNEKKLKSMVLELAERRDALFAQKYPHKKQEPSPAVLSLANEREANLWDGLIILALIFCVGLVGGNCMLRLKVKKG